MKPFASHASTKVLMVFVFSCLFTAAPALAVRPTVVKTTPANGAKDVDPATRQIVIEFDQDMDTRGDMSICGGGDSYPKTVGRPRWHDKRTLILNVRLIPNHEYYFSVNCPAFQNTQSAAGESVVPYDVSFRTSDGKQKEVTQREMNADAIRILKEAIGQDYSYYERLGIDWDAQFKDYEQMLLDADSPKRFAQLAAAMLSSAKDKHIWIDAQGERIPSYRNPITPNANAQRLPILVPNYQQQSDVVYAGQFDDQIGYFRIDAWATQNPRAYETVYRWIGEHPDAKGLIIDVRFNGGGSDALAGDLAGCFITEPVLHSKHVIRDPKSDNGFSKVYDRILEPNAGRPHFPGKVAVLSGPVVMSSCETFILMMKQAPNATVFGQTTRGSSGNPRAYDLSNGVTVFLPSWKDMRPDGTEIEGIGIQPDVLLETQPNDFAENDPVLDAALEHLRK